jgi:hypothetical protein
MHRVPIIVHTNSEYSFLWKAAIPLLEKYAPDFQITWCTDSLLDFTLPPSWKLHLYDPHVSWGFRIQGVLDTLDADYVIYLQEDLLLIDSMSTERIDACIDFMKEHSSEFLMSYPHNATSNELFAFNQPKYNNFVCIKQFSHYMQPAIWKKTLLHEICSLNVPLSQNESEQCFRITSTRNCYGVVNIAYPELATRSFFFPHMHAIYQGKWTFEKYPCLKALVEAHGIDTSTREVDRSWTLHHQ